MKLILVATCLRMMFNVFTYLDFILYVTMFVISSNLSSFLLPHTTGVERKLKVKNIENVLHIKVNTNVQEMVLQMAYAGIDAKVLYASNTLMRDTDECVIIMCAYVHIYIYICIQIYIYVYIYIRIFICMYNYMQIIQTENISKSD
jgi:hypothetical protein